MELALLWNRYLDGGKLWIPLSLAIYFGCLKFDSKTLPHFLSLGNVSFHFCSFQNVGNGSENVQ